MAFQVHGEHCILTRKDGYDYIDLETTATIAHWPIPRINRVLVAEFGVFIGDVQFYEFATGKMHAVPEHWVLSTGKRYLCRAYSNRTLEPFPPFAPMSSMVLDARHLDETADGRFRMYWGSTMRTVCDTQGKLRRCAFNAALLMPGLPRVVCEVISLL